MKKLYIFLMCAIVLLVALGLEGCNQQLEWKFIGGGPSCTADNQGALSCVGRYIQQCGMVNDAPAWVVLQDCGVSGMICDNGNCVLGCNVDGSYSCAGDVSYVCDAGSLIVNQDCSATGKTCQNGACVINATRCSDSTDMDSCLDNPACYWDQETNRCYDYKQNCTDPDNGDNIYLAAHTFGFREYSSAEDPSRDLRIRTGGMDACLSNNQLIEHYCYNTYLIQTTYRDCPDVCKDGACVAAPEKVSLNLNYGDEINDKLGRPLTSNDFPALLKGGDLVYKDMTGRGATPYKQSLQFISTTPDKEGVSVLGTGQLVFAANDDGEKIAADYLAFDDDSIDEMYIHQISFDTPVPCSNALAGASINMLGNTFTITSVESTSASACSKIILTGANVEYQLIDGMEVYKNGVKISGSRVILAAATTPGEIKAFVISYTPLDEEYVAEGTSIVDPIFGSFKIQLNGLSKNQEQIDLEVSSDGLAAKIIGLKDANGNEIPVSFRVEDGVIKSNPTGTNRAYVSKYGATIALSDDGNNPFYVYLIEEDTNLNNLKAKIGLSYNASTNKTTIASPLIMEAGNGMQWYKSGIPASTTNKYLKYYVTEWGTLMNYDSSSMKKLTIWYPDTQVFGTVDITNS